MRTGSCKVYGIDLDLNVDRLQPSLTCNNIILFSVIFRRNEKRVVYCCEVIASLFLPKMPKIKCFQAS